MKGLSVTLFATTKKVVTILWSMLFKNQHCNPLTIYEYLNQKRKRNISGLQKQIANLNARMSKIKLI